MSVPSDVDTTELSLGHKKFSNYMLSALSPYNYTTKRGVYHIPRPKTVNNKDNRFTILGRCIDNELLNIVGDFYHGIFRKINRPRNAGYLTVRKLSWEEISRPENVSASKSRSSPCRFPIPSQSMEYKNPGMPVQLGLKPHYSTTHRPLNSPCGR